MYDRITEELIRGVPDLEGLDREDLPRRLTEAFATIVSLRVRWHSGKLDDSSDRMELDSQLALLRRLASTFETLACVLEEGDKHRLSCAFVAATAHQLLHRAGTIFAQRLAMVDLDAAGISSRLAALLLFFIAGAFPDATEVAQQVAMDPENTIESLLVRALVALAQGNLAHVLELPPTPEGARGAESIEDRATELLWKRLYTGARMLATELLEGRTTDGAKRDSLVVFREVQQLAVVPLDRDLLPWIGDGEAPDKIAPPVYRVFGGPHHLATLLVASWGMLRERAVTLVHPPSKDIDGTKWLAFLRRLARTRPCLWPNHLKAVEAGLLTPGTSAAISFPTGAGKSTLVQLKIAATLLRGRRAVFLVPTHALLDQVRRDLSEMFPESKINTSPLLDEMEETSGSGIDVMTPERCLARIGVSSDFLRFVGLIVFDECHLLHDREDQRSLDAMLCLLNLIDAAPDADVVLLSAMMANAGEMADWVSSLQGRTCLALDLDWKPTRQARGCVLYRSSDVGRLARVLAEERALSEEEARSQGKKWKGSPSSNIGRRLGIIPYGLFCLQHTWHTLDTEDYSVQRLLTGTVDLSAGAGTDSWYLNANRNHVSARLAAGFAASGMKTMILVQMPRDLSSLAQTAADHLWSRATPVTLNLEEKELLAIASEELGDEMYAFRPVRGLVAIHHGLLLPSERRLSERLFARKDGIAALAVSPTLSQGVNLPAEAIVIAGDDRWEPKADARRDLEAHELLNAAGRAGRAGSSALGIVLVVPGQVVGFDEATHKIDRRWFDLQERVFSRSDQCLTIQDPLEGWLDRLQHAAQEQPLEEAARYFLARLPVDREGSGDAPRRFLTRSLGAYHAKKKEEGAHHAQMIEHALLLRKIHAGHSGTWHDTLSFATGFPVSVIRDIDETLQGDSDIESRDTSAWVRWWFGWMRQDANRALALLGDTLLARLFPKPFKESPTPGDLHAQVLTRLESIVLAWMEGTPLRSLENMLGTPPQKVGMCMAAREFALRHVPSVAYAVDLVARVRRAQTEQKLHEAIPIALRSLAGCVRGGFHMPEQLAVYHFEGVEGSRVRCHRRYTEVAGDIRPGRPTESFRDTRNRVLRAIRKHDA